MDSHPDLYRLHDPKGNNYTFVLAGDRDGRIPGVQNCRGCARTWADSSEAVPSFEVDAHPERVALRAVGSCTVEEVNRIVAAVRPHTPAWTTLRPGTPLGRWHGTVEREPQELMLSRGSGSLPHVVLSPRLQNELAARGVNLPTRVAVDLEHRTRGKPKDLRGYVELEVPPGVELHASSFAPVPRGGPGCDVCGYPSSALAIQQFIVAEASRMPPGWSMCRVANARGEVLVTASCRGALLACGVSPAWFGPVGMAPPT